MYCKYFSKLIWTCPENQETSWSDTGATSTRTLQFKASVFLLSSSSQISVVMVWSAILRPLCSTDTAEIFQPIKVISTLSNTWISLLATKIFLSQWLLTEKRSEPADDVTLHNFLTENIQFEILQASFSTSRLNLCIKVHREENTSHCCASHLPGLILAVRPRGYRQNIKLGTSVKSVLEATSAFSAWGKAGDTLWRWDQWRKPTWRRMRGEHYRY